MEQALLTLLQGLDSQSTLAQHAQVIENHRQVLVEHASIINVHSTSLDAANRNDIRLQAQIDSLGTGLVGTAVLVAAVLLLSASVVLLWRKVKLLESRIVTPTPALTAAAG